jgi:hypothetical protein
MVYVVQNYLAFLDSIHRLVCGSFTKDHNVSETGSVSVLRWMGQDRPTQLGPSERTSPVIETISRILLPDDGPMRPKHVAGNKYSIVQY